MSGSRLIERLIEALRALPGVGPKSAQRMAYHLLERDREGGRRLAAVLQQAMEQVGHCRDCRTLSEESLCALCASGRRDRGLGCLLLRRGSIPDAHGRTAGQTPRTTVEESSN